MIGRKPSNINQIPRVELHPIAVVIMGRLGIEVKPLSDHDRLCRRVCRLGDDDAFDVARLLVVPNLARTDLTHPGTVTKTSSSVEAFR